MGTKPDLSSVLAGLDVAARRAKLFEAARSPWALKWEDLSYIPLLAVISYSLFTGSGDIPASTVWLVLLSSTVGAWHAKRLERRLDAIVRLLDSPAEP